MADEHDNNAGEGLELERTRRERALAEQRTLELRAEEARKREEKQQLLAQQQFRDDVAGSGPRFHLSADEVLQVMNKDGYDIRYDNGSASCVLDGERVPLVEGVRHFAVTHRNLVSDRRTLPHSEQDAPKIRSRADLVTTAEKAAYIDKHGLRAYEALPAVALPNGAPRTYSEYMSLPSPARVRLHLGEAEIAQLIYNEKRR